MFNAKREVKDQSLTLRVTEAERTIIEEQATKGKHKNISVYLRHLIEQDLKGE